MKIAKLRITYELPISDSAKEAEQINKPLPGADLARRLKQISTSTQVLGEIVEEYDVGGTYKAVGPELYVLLIQKPSILRNAFEDLINSELGAPSRIYPGSESRFSGIEAQEEKQGFEIAKQLLSNAGYELSPYYSIFHVFCFFPEYYFVEKKKT